MNVHENRLNRDFSAPRPNLEWVTDISCTKAKQGVLYLSMIKDLYDNFIVSYDMGITQDNALVYRTIKKARKEVADGLSLHSGRGFRYTSRGYSNLLKQYSVLPSMSRAGTPLDKCPGREFLWDTQDGMPGQAEDPDDQGGENADSRVYQLLQL